MKAQPLTRTLALAAALLAAALPAAASIPRASSASGPSVRIESPTLADLADGTTPVDLEGGWRFEPNPSPSPAADTTWEPERLGEGTFQEAYEEERARSRWESAVRGCLGDPDTCSGYLYLARYKYDAWGLFRDDTEDTDGFGFRNPTNQQLVNRTTYTGHYYDRETGLYSTQSRYLDPETGRFISQDGLEYGNAFIPPSLHRYLYAQANPLRYRDLDGHESSLSQLLQRGVDRNIEQEDYLQAYGFSFVQTAYRGLDKLTGGAFSGHDDAFDRYEAGLVSGSEYVQQAEKSVAQVGAFAATGVLGKALAGTRAGVVAAGAIEGAAGGLGAQAADDVGKGRLSAAGDYIASGTGGAILGGAFAGGVQVAARGAEKLLQSGVGQSARGAAARIVQEGRKALARIGDVVSDPRPPVAPSVALRVQKAIGAGAAGGAGAGSGAGTRESAGARILQMGDVAGSASTRRSVITSVQASLGEAEAYKGSLLLGEVGIQGPGHANAIGPDFITAVEDAATGEFRILITDVKTSTVGGFRKPRTGIPIAWGRETRAALDRLDLGDPALEARIRDAFTQGRVFPRQLNVDYSPNGQGSITGF